MDQAKKENLKEIILDWRDGGTNLHNAIQELEKVCKDPTVGINDCYVGADFSSDIGGGSVSFDANTSIGCSGTLDLNPGGVGWLNSLANPVSGRLSCTSPNISNVPKTKLDIDGLENNIRDLQESPINEREKDPDPHYQEDTYIDDDNFHRTIQKWTGGFQGWQEFDTDNPQWQCKDGRIVPVEIMTRAHLKNALIMVRSQLDAQLRGFYEQDRVHIFEMWRTVLLEELSKRR